MTDVLKKLPPFSWRGFQYPVTARAVSFQHEKATHKIQFLDGEFIEQLGVTNLVFAYTIPMREDIAKGPYKHLFTEGLIGLFDSCRNRKVDTLNDPVYGEFRCVPSSYSDETDVIKRDGTDIRVEFMVSPQPPEVLNENVGLALANLHGLASDAGRLDGDVAALSQDQIRAAFAAKGVTFNAPSPIGTTDILSALNGAGRQVTAAADRQRAALADVAFRTEKLEDTLDVLGSPQTWKLRNDARSARDAANRLATRDGTGSTVKIRRITTNSRMTVSAIAAEAGVTVGALLESNPALARSPVVPAHTVVIVRE